MLISQIMKKEFIKRLLIKTMLDNIFLYIDPSTTSALIAGILGALAGAAMYIRTKWHSIRYRNKGKK